MPMDGVKTDRRCDQPLNRVTWNQRSVPLAHHRPSISNYKCGVFFESQPLPSSLLSSSCFVAWFFVNGKVSNFLTIRGLRCCLTNAVSLFIRRGWLNLEAPPLPSPFFRRCFGSWLQKLNVQQVVIWNEGAHNCTLTSLSRSATFPPTNNLGHRKFNDTNTRIQNRVIHHIYSLTWIFSLTRFPMSSQKIVSYNRLTKEICDQGKRKRQKKGEKEKKGERKKKN